jgi:FixJ family two-component response regulator
MEVADSPIVYVVDDDMAVRVGLRHLCESVGLRAAVFPSTAEFLQSSRSDNASCLILDVRLPGLSGLDFQAELAAAKITIPIIFITGYGDIPMTVKAMKAGAVEFLTKPLREQDLLDAVVLALERDRAVREHDNAHRDLRARYDRLNLRERQVMSLVTAGLMNKQVAAEIGLTTITVKHYRRDMMQKLGAKSVADLVRIADLLEISRDCVAPWGPSNRVPPTARLLRNSDRPGTDN